MEDSIQIMNVSSPEVIVIDDDAYDYEDRDGDIEVIEINKKVNSIGKLKPGTGTIASASNGIAKISIVDKIDQQEITARSFLTGRRVVSPTDELEQLQLSCHQNNETIPLEPLSPVRPVPVPPVQKKPEKQKQATPKPSTSQSAAAAIPIFNVTGNDSDLSVIEIIPTPGSSKVKPFPGTNRFGPNPVFKRRLSSTRSPSASASAAGSSTPTNAKRFKISPAFSSASKLSKNALKRQRKLKRTLRQRLERRRLNQSQQQRAEKFNNSRVTNSQQHRQHERVPRMRQEDYQGLAANFQDQEPVPRLRQGDPPVLASTSPREERMFRRQQRQQPERVSRQPQREQRPVLPTSSGSGHERVPGQQRAESSRSPPSHTLQQDRVSRQQPEDPPALGLSVFGGNLFAPTTTSAPRRGELRPIVIDGSNVAMAHGNNKTFSCRGIRLCVDYFIARGHPKIIAFVPHFKARRAQILDKDLLDKLEAEGIVKTTPGRMVNGQRISAYDDRFIVQSAAQIGGVVVSNDNFRDLYQQEPSWRETIHKRVLQYVWISDDMIMFPDDPLGRGKPRLNDILRF